MPDASDHTIRNDQGQPQGEDFAQFVPDQILETKYRVISILGKGGMGTVYRVEQIFLKRDLALKVLDSRGAFSDVQVRRFQTEGRAAFCLNHPNLVKVHDSGIFENGQPYLVMDYVPGKTLAELIKEQGALTLDQIAKIFPQACFGIAYAHQQQIIHRDIKPSNIMLVDGIATGEEGSVKMFDFGIAKVAGEEGGEIQALTKTGEIFGSPLYMSPEQCSGEQIDTRSDIYSLGCVLFEALTGTPPLVGNNALRTMMLHQTEAVPSLKEASMGKDFPPALEKIVQKMLQKSPGERYDSLGVVALELGEACKGNMSGEKQVLASAVATTKRNAPNQAAPAASIGSKLVNPSFIAGLLVAGALAATGGVLFMVFSPDEKINDPTGEPNKPSLKPKARSAGADDLSAAVNDFDPAGRSENIKAFGNVDVSPDEMEKQIAIWKSCAPIKSQPIQQNGKAKKRFVFPEANIGRLTNRLKAQDTFEKVAFGKIDTVGVQLVPADSPLTLEVNYHTNRAVFDYPSVLEKIGKGDINELLLNTRVPVTVTSPMSEEPLILSTVRMLKICSTWTNLQSVVLLDLPQSKEILDAVNQCRSLDRFHISSPTDTGKNTEDPVKELGSSKWAVQVVRQPFVKKLKHLGLEEMQVAEVLKALNLLSRLESLELTDTRVSGPAILSLRNCPHLQILRFCEHTGATDEQLKALAQLKQLHILYIKETNITSQQLKLIQESARSTKLYISSRSQQAVSESNAKDSPDPRIELVPER